MMQFKTGTEAQLLGNHVLAGETVLLIEDSVLFPDSPSPHPNMYFAARKTGLYANPMETLIKENWIKNYFLPKDVVENTRTHARQCIIIALYRSEFRVKGSHTRRRGRPHKMRLAVPDVDV